MKRSVTFWITALLMVGLVGSVFALPTAKIKVLGVTPRTVAINANDIYTVTSTGLGNVGVGEKTYLAGNQGDTTITAWSWTLTARPNNSTAALSAGDQAVITLRPDLSGTYTITLQVTNATGQSDPVTYKVNAANYAGVGEVTGEANAPECAGCHAGQVDDVYSAFNNTKHASIFSRNYDGADGSGYRLTCLKCHTTGWNVDTLAVNHGFDDEATAEGWAFIDSANGGLRAGAWDAMKQNFPNTSNKANIQCEACHGPGSRHNGNTADNRMSKSLDTGICARCHDSGSNHIKTYQWNNSLHAHAIEESRTGCVDCHSGRGFIENLAGVPDSLANLEYVPINCSTCHDPHSATNEFQLRNVAPYRLMNGVEVDFGLGNLCVRCHHSRVDVRTYPAARPTSRFGPHHGPQGEMLAGTGGVEFGREMRNGPHAALVENGCVGCHMAATPVAGAGLNTVGAHTFAMVANGVENTAACAECHGEVESFEAFQAGGDWDHDGTTESVQAEILGMQNTIIGMLPRGAAVPDTNYTLAQKQAYYNYIFVVEDKSQGMHNAYYARDLLQAAIDNIPVGRTLRVNLLRGWNTMSINVTPARNLWVGNQGADVRRMLQSLRIDQQNHHVQVMKDDLGNFYLPQFDFNNIAYWSLIDGYQIKVDEDVTIEWTGLAIDPTADIPLAQGWNTVPYYPTYFLSAEAPDLPVVASIRDHLLVAKDDMGRFMLPAFEFSNMNPWAKGKGYQVKVDANCTLNYPAEQRALAASEEVIVAGPWGTFTPTGSSMSLLITDVVVPNGSQICAVSKSAAIVGVGSVQDGRCGLAVWGDDQTTDAVDGLLASETFSLKLWNVETGIQAELSAKMVLGSGLVFKSDDFAVAKAVVLETVPATYYLGLNYPNPFNSSTRIAFGLPTAGKVSVKVYDLAGRVIATLAEGDLSAGNHLTLWNADSAPAGLYLVKMEAGSFSDTRKVTLLK